MWQLAGRDRFGQPAVAYTGMIQFVHAGRLSGLTAADSNHKRLLASKRHIAGIIK